MKKNIAVVFGGISTEHDVSIITAHFPIIASLQASGQFDVYSVYISKKGLWYSDKSMNDLDYFKDANLEEKISKQKSIQVNFNNGLEIVWSGVLSKKIKIDVVFPAMHGPYGEDGSLMGLLRMAGVPFVGCDIFASSVAMDKVLTKKILETEKVSIIPYVWFTKNDWLKEKNNILGKIRNLKWPLFVKPAHLGSSIGISKVKNEEDLLRAIEVALHYDDKVLVEEAVEDLIEVTLPIMGNEELIFGAIERPLNQGDMFDFDSKYLSGGKEGGVNSDNVRELPARISEELSGEVISLGERTYKALGCEGISRVDFLIDRKINKVYVNEVNTLPGSLYHHNWKSVGISGVELVTKLVSLAEERFLLKKEITHTFKSDILKNTGGGKKF